MPFKLSQCGTFLSIQDLMFIFVYELFKPILIRRITKDYCMEFGINSKENGKIGESFNSSINSQHVLIPQHYIMTLLTWCLNTDGKGTP